MTLLKQANEKDWHSSSKERFLLITIQATNCYEQFIKTVKNFICIYNLKLSTKFHMPQSQTKSL